VKAGARCVEAGGSQVLGQPGLLARP
jgi:hypothetical protein